MHKILIVEDDQTYLESIKQEFPQTAYQILTANDGETGLNTAISQLPDLIILDIMLPKMLGITLVQNLLKNDQTKNIPVIAVTNFGGAANKQRALEAGVKEFLVKSEITTHELAEIVENYLPKAS